MSGERAAIAGGEDREIKRLYGNRYSKKLDEL